jgi:hypothetical protein
MNPQADTRNAFKRVGKARNPFQRVWRARRRFQSMPVVAGGGVVAVSEVPEVSEV